MDIEELVHGELTKAGVKLAATLPDDWVSPVIRRLVTDPAIKHIPVGREAEAMAICCGAFFGGVRSVAIIGTTGLHSCTGELMTMHLRHGIPVFIIASMRGSLDDHQVYQEPQGRHTIPMLQAYGFPYYVVDRPEEIGRISNAYQHCRLQKRPCVLFLTRNLLNVGKVS
jgi:sulfopyruvate decarboxylase subunit alpha